MSQPVIRCANQPCLPCLEKYDAFMTPDWSRVTLENVRLACQMYDSGVGREGGQVIIGGRIRLIHIEYRPRSDDQLTARMAASAARLIASLDPRARRTRRGTAPGCLTT